MSSRSSSCATALPAVGQAGQSHLVVAHEVKKSVAVSRRARRDFSVPFVAIRFVFRIFSPLFQLSDFLTDHQGGDDRRPDADCRVHRHFFLRLAYRLRPMMISPDTPVIADVV